MQATTKSLVFDRFDVWFVGFDYVLNIAESKPEHRIEWQRESGAFKVNEGSWTLNRFPTGKLWLRMPSTWMAAF